MMSQDSQWLTTGETAKLCCVEPDTIRKWIKGGRLKAEHTIGGHHRIQWRDLARHIPTPRISDDALTEQLKNFPQPMRCWEYLSKRGEVRAKCKNCVVYRIRAACCYAVAELDSDIGHAREFCGQTCQECVYFRRIKGLDTRVLVVSPDKEFTGILGSGKDEGISLRFAGNSYEASAIIHSFRPAFVVVDQSLNEAECKELIESLADDPRIPGVKIILTVPYGRTGVKKDRLRSKVLDGKIKKPFSKRQFASLIGKFPVEAVAEVNGV